MLRELSKWTMYVGMAIAMVAGATWPSPMWGFVSLGLAVIAAGIVMKRKAGPPPLDDRGLAGSGEKPARTGTLAEGLAFVAAEVEALAKAAKDCDLETIKKTTEDLNWLGPERVGQSQEAIAAKIGFPAYAEIMAPLATAERLLYRAWSAASDGHRPEAIASLEAAVPYAKQAAELAKSKLG